MDLFEAVPSYAWDEFLKCPQVGPGLLHAILEHAPELAQARWCMEDVLRPLVKHPAVQASDVDRACELGGHWTRVDRASISTDPLEVARLLEGVSVQAAWASAVYSLHDPSGVLAGLALAAVPGSTVPRAVLTKQSLPYEVVLTAAQILARRPSVHSGVRSELRSASYRHPLLAAALLADPLVVDSTLRKSLARIAAEQASPRTTPPTRGAGPDFISWLASSPTPAQVADYIRSTRSPAAALEALRRTVDVDGLVAAAASDVLGSSWALAAAVLGSANPSQQACAKAAALIVRSRKELPYGQASARCRAAVLASPELTALAASKGDYQAALRVGGKVATDALRHGWQRGRRAYEFSSKVAAAFQVIGCEAADEEMLDQAVDLLTERQPYGKRWVSQAEADRMMDFRAACMRKGKPAAVAGMTLAQLGSLLPGTPGMSVYVHASHALGRWVGQGLAELIGSLDSTSSWIVLEALSTGWPGTLGDLVNVSADVCTVPAAACA